VLIAHKLSRGAAAAKGGGTCGEAAHPAFYAGAFGEHPRPLFPTSRRPEFPTS